MTFTLIYGDRAPVEVESLLVEPAVIGWEMKPAGLCRGDICVPFPVDEGRVDVLALAKRLGQAVAREHDVVVVGERRATPSPLDAPDFELPDVDGRMHALRDHRGTKVLLVSWASW